MTVATALVSGNDPLPQLAEEAVHQALAKAGLTHANGVLLFLTPEFARHARQTVTAVARASQCTQVAGGISSGVLTESGWALDRPAAAVMVFGGGLSLGHPDAETPCVLSYAGGAFPATWAASRRRFGGLFSGRLADSAVCTEPLAWQQGRVSEENRCEAQILGADLRIGVSSGLRLLGTPLRIDRSNGFDLEATAGLNARQSLEYHLPAEFRDYSDHQLHYLSAALLDTGLNPESAVAEGRYRPVAIIAVNADHSLTLTERVLPGQSLCWAIREPLAAQADMRNTLDHLAQDGLPPSCALMFSCIGRGPYFYGGDDLDLNVLRQRFPGLPILGAYGTGQIAPCAGKQPQNRLLQNAVLTALVSKNAAKADIRTFSHAAARPLAGPLRLT